VRRPVDPSLPTWVKVLRYTTLVVLAITVLMAAYVVVVLAQWDIPIR
jgi:hypothetical protein